MDPAGILLRTPLFRDLAPVDVEELVPDLHERRYGRGEAVWLEGDRAEALVVVAAGQLKAHRVSTAGREVILGVIGEFAVTGEVGLFHPVGLRWLNLSAMTESRCLLVRRAPLLGFLTRHPAAMQRMLEQLSSLAVRAAYSFTGMAFDDIGARVANLLLYLADQHGEPTPGGVRIRLRLSQTEVAAYVGASRESVNRALHTLIEQGVVGQRGGHFYVRDRAVLDAVVREAAGSMRAKA
ncbi:MAG: Crp/Fnr family transcriptional regulator [Actinomycetes bacterium]